MGADEQRYRDYVEDLLGHFKVAKINSLQIKNILNRVTDDHGHSITTRTRVRALLSKVFGDAVNNDPPLRTFNPALNLTFDDARLGKKKPKFIKKDKDAELFLETALAMSWRHGVYAATKLMAGPRKSEMAAFKWKNFDPEQKTLSVTSRFVQAENRIIEGTKAGLEEARVIPIPDALSRNSERMARDLRNSVTMTISFYTGPILLRIEATSCLIVIYRAFTMR